MSHRIVLVPFVLLLLLLSHDAKAEEPPKKPPPIGLPSARDLLGLGEMSRAAADLRKAGEAFARFSVSLDGIVGKIAESLARMSSEFDPFGYKTAFRTIAQQNEIIEKQSETIRALHEREIKRLQSENERLRKRLKKKASR